MVKNSYGPGDSEVLTIEGRNLRGWASSLNESIILTV